MFRVLLKAGGQSQESVFFLRILRSSKRVYFLQLGSAESYGSGFIKDYGCYFSGGLEDFSVFNKNSTLRTDAGTDH